MSSIEAVLHNQSNSASPFVIHLVHSSIRKHRSSGDGRNVAKEQNFSRSFVRLSIINVVERLNLDTRRMGASEDFLFERSLNRRMRKTGWHMTFESTEVDMRVDFSACRSKGAVIMDFRRCRAFIRALGKSVYKARLDHPH
jgi:hypothetical protein